MATSDEELQELESEVQGKRERLANALRDREEQERSLSNDVVAQQLRAESARLDAALAEEQARASLSQRQENSAITQAKVEAEAAQAQADATAASSEQSDSEDNGDEREGQ